MEEGVAKMLKEVKRCYTCSRALIYKHSLDSGQF